MSDFLRPHELQHARPPCPSPTPRVHSDSCPVRPWCHPAISSSVVPFSSCPQSLPASESFPMSQLFAWGVQSTGVSALASFLPKKSQGWSPSEIKNSFGFCPPKIIYQKPWRHGTGEINIHNANYKVVIKHMKMLNMKKNMILYYSGDFWFQEFNHGTIVQHRSMKRN